MKGGRAVHRIIYFTRIRKRGVFGIPYTVVKPRTAHVDERRWRQIKDRPFSIRELMCMPSNAIES